MDDDRRIFYIIKSLAKTGHPYTNFSVGSLETLKIPNIREYLFEFYKSYYSANIMKLILYSSHSINELEALVREKF